jgi:hypothetical protein
MNGTQTATVAVFDETTELLRKRSLCACFCFCFITGDLPRNKLDEKNRGL